LLIDRPVSNTDRVVNTVTSPVLVRVRRLVAAYVVVVVATVAVLATLSAVAPEQATDEAWGHALIVGVFAVLLPMRLRAAMHGSVRALRAVGFIAAALFLVNLIEALIPGLFPAWMRAEMVGIAVLMAGVILSVMQEKA
jgi:hypothetical protein